MIGVDGVYPLGVYSCILEVNFQGDLVLLMGSCGGYWVCGWSCSWCTLIAVLFSENKNHISPSRNQIIFMYTKGNVVVVLV